MDKGFDNSFSNRCRPRRLSQRAAQDLARPQKGTTPIQQK